MKNKHTLPGLVETFSLLGLACFLGYLALAGNYWMYLNPKFKPLSITAAAAMGALGVFSLLRPPANANWFRAALFAFVIALCVTSELGIQSWFAASGIDSASAEQDQADLPPRVSKGGVEYVRINLGELYDIAAKTDPGKLDTAYAVRGFVRRSPEGDAKGEFILYRVALYCCYADSTAVGFRVRPPKGLTLPENGSWQVVYGHLTKDADPQSDKISTIEGSAFASVQPDFRLDASRIEADKVPGTGLMYEWRAEEPYAY